jgi:hypothetical protein
MNAAFMPYEGMGGPATEDPADPLLILRDLPERERWSAWRK